MCAGLPLLLGLLPIHSHTSGSRLVLDQVKSTRTSPGPRPHPQQVSHRKSLELSSCPSVHELGPWTPSCRVSKRKPWATEQDALGTPAGPQGWGLGPRGSPHPKSLQPRLTRPHIWGQSHPRGWPRHSGAGRGHLSKFKDYLHVWGLSPGDMMGGASTKMGGATPVCAPPPSPLLGPQLPAQGLPKGREEARTCVGPACPQPQPVCEERRRGGRLKWPGCQPGGRTCEAGSCSCSGWRAGCPRSHRCWPRTGAGA